MVKRRIGGWIQAGFALVLSVGLFGAHAQTQDGVQVGSTSKFAKLVPAADVETASAQQYNKMLQTAASKQALVPPHTPSCSVCAILPKESYPTVTVGTPVPSSGRGKSI